MSVIVINPPPVVVSAADARTAGVFSSDDDDAMIDALLAAAQATIDGPDGWLGRAIGLQTLELSVVGGLWCVRWPHQIKLPYLPIRSITSAKTVTDDGTETTIDPSAYSLTGDVLTFTDTMSRNALRIRYVAGYGTAEGGSDLPLPPPIKFAIMLMAKQLSGLGDTGGEIVREEVTGVGVTAYAASKVSEDLLQTTGERLLSTYRVFQ